MAKKKPENIVLKNVSHVTVDNPDGEFTLFAKGGHVEFFMDEHNLQWVKFIPKNGNYAGQDHSIPRERVINVVMKNHQGKVHALETPLEAERDVHPGMLKDA